MAPQHGTDYWDEHAAAYDQQALEKGWYGHEVLFGLMFSDIQRGQSVLDMGIGTGLGSSLFHQAGLLVSGFDESDAMLMECARKGYVGTLQRHDLRITPLPYDDKSFDNILSLAVFSFLPDLNPIICETSRIIKPGGLFGFSIERRSGNNDIRNVSAQTGDGEEFPLYCHSDAEINTQIGLCGFSVEKKFVFRSETYGEEDFQSVIYLAKKG
jgi:predicted TPR repeat methyltransferase